MPHDTVAFDRNLYLPAPGLLSRRVFCDEDLYELEKTRIFGRTWQLLAHESMIPDPGDYITTHIGEDPIIVSRDSRGEIHAMVNSCRHRGNKVCLFDRGNTQAFTCSYHGWSFATDGSLRSVPYLRGAYYNDLDRSQWGLQPVTRVATHRGLIFGCFDPDVPGLEEDLGDARFYLDHLVLGQWGDGIEVISGPHSYMINANWKIIAENGAGDHYHTLFTHKSIYRLGELEEVGYTQEQEPDGPFEVSLPGGHGIGGVYTGAAGYERDLEMVDKLGLGASVRRYVTDRYHAKLEALGDHPSRPYQCSHGNLFPNFSFSGHGGALAGRGIYVLQPVGPLQTRTWQWVVVESSAPELVKELAAQNMGEHGQLATGLFAQDDIENFERVTESALIEAARDVPFHLGMGLHQEGRWPEQESWQTEGLPGLVGPRFSEHGQRGVYDRWADMMASTS